MSPTSLYLVIQREKITHAPYCCPPVSPTGSGVSVGESADVFVRPQAISAIMYILNLDLGIHTEKGKVWHNHLKSNFVVALTL